MANESATQSPSSPAAQISSPRPNSLPEQLAGSSTSSGNSGSVGRSRARIRMPVITQKPEQPPQVACDFNLEDHCMMRFDETSFETLVRVQDLELVSELGRGAYGVVDQMRHRPTGKEMAVKRITSSMNDEEQRRMFTELRACMRSDCCPQMVRFFGAMFREGDVWLCMEVMRISLDKFYRAAFLVATGIPEPFVARVALSVVEGLNFMKEQMQLIHRDVKPSNILLSDKGEVKLCDFGISGVLTDSLAKTVSAGCKPYMPPERIEGEHRDRYDVRADVWSLGITLVEISTGQHPYAKWRTPFEQLKQVVVEPPPKLPAELGFSSLSHDFIAHCLTKDFTKRPKYAELLAHPLLETARNQKPTAAAKFINEVLDKLQDVDASELSVELRQKLGLK